MLHFTHALDNIFSCRVTLYNVIYSVIDVNGQTRGGNLNNK